ncbi:MAG: hypothetical protein QOI26_64, partial [Pseudonocardiales bacterium]|nr:hypothetical protein [Pseudonocardiales bacterium]
MILLQIPEHRTTAELVAIGLIGSELQSAGVASSVLPAEA